MIGNASACPAALAEIIAEHAHHGKRIVMVSKPAQRIVVPAERSPRVTADGHRIRQAHNLAPGREQAEELRVKHPEVGVDELRAFLINAKQILDAAHGACGFDTIGFVEYPGEAIGGKLPTQCVFRGRPRFLIVKAREAMHQ